MRLERDLARSIQSRRLRKRGFRKPVLSSEGLLFESRGLVRGLLEVEHDAVMELRDCEYRNGDCGG